MNTHHWPRDKHIWRFGQSVLDERTLGLYVQGRAVHLHRKPMQVLLYLLRRSGELVTKDELAAACWPRRVLSDTVLTTTINRLRVVLGDRDRVLIRTQHGFGYRLAGSIHVERAPQVLRPPVGQAAQSPTLTEVGYAASFNGQ